MPVNRKRHAVDGAGRERWALLGLRLRARRIELGYPVRRAFAEARGLITERGAPNVRMINAIENNERPGSYMPGRLEQFARAYEVTPASVYALLAGKTDELAPAHATGPLPVLPPRPPESGLLREDLDYRYFRPIYDRVLELADQGNPDPSGAELGLPPDEADMWDSTRRTMPRSDRAWAVADFQRRQADRRARPNPDAGASTA